MANGKYIRVNDTTGLLEELEALEVSTGVADASKPIKTDSTGKIDLSLMPVGIGPDTQDIVCTENLSAGDFVNIYNNAGSVAVRKADRSNGRQAHGFVLQNYSSAQTAKVYKDSENNALVGLTIGAAYYLGTGGAVSLTPPAAGSGQLLQALGVAMSATELDAEIEKPIVRN
jgi:hypothetical protein